MCWHKEQDWLDSPSLRFMLELARSGVESYRKNEVPSEQSQAKLEELRTFLQNAQRDLSLIGSTPPGSEAMAVLESFALIEWGGNQALGLAEYRTTLECLLTDCPVADEDIKHFLRFLDALYGYCRGEVVPVSN